MVAWPTNVRNTPDTSLTQSIAQKLLIPRHLPQTSIFIFKKKKKKSQSLEPVYPHFQSIEMPCMFEFDQILLRYERPS